MSATTSPATTTTPTPVILGATEAVLQSSSVTTLRTNLETAVRNGATDVPDAIKALTPLDPDLAPKALIASKSPWGTLAVSAVVWLSAKYGLGWDEGTCAVVGGGAVLLGSFVMRYITTARIGGVLSAAPAPAAAPAAVP